MLNAKIDLHRFENDTFDLDTILFHLENGLSDLLCWVTHPHNEPLGDGWVASYKQKLGKPFQKLSKECNGPYKIYLHLNEYEIERARKDALSFISFLRDRPKVSTVRIEEWSDSLQPQINCHNRIAAFVEKIKDARNRLDAQTSKLKAELDQASKQVQIAESSNSAETIHEPVLLPIKSPKNLLQGWPEIFKALNRRFSDHQKRKLRALSERTNGPLHGHGQGKSPTVDEPVLLEWWNRQDERNSELANKRQDRKLSSEGYSFGKDAEVVPEINGSIKKKRQKKT